jgi:hypothetical protein
MDISPSLREMLICSADARRQVVARDGETNSGSQNPADFPGARKILDPARAAKKLKALPHIYLAQYDWSLYVDNTVRY